MATAFFCMFVALGFPTFRVMFSDHAFVAWGIAFLVIASGLASCFPLLIEWSTARRARFLADRARWRDEYKASPESHLLHLTHPE
jgi:hypothetical protein